MIEIPDHLLANKMPFFVCSRRILEKQVIELRSLGVEVLYSVKTNPDIEILRELQRLGVGFSVSNQPEFLSVISIGAKPENIIYYERGLTNERVSWLVKAGCRNFVVESRAAFDNLKPEIKSDMTVLIRLKAEPASTRYMGNYSPGVEPEVAKELIIECKKLGTKVGILHHGSSQIDDSEYWKKKFELLSDIKGVDIIDIGGGIPIDYNGGVYEKIFTEIKNGIAKIRTNTKRILTEPGRFIVGPACSLVSRVEIVDGENAVLNCSVYNVHIDTIIADLVLPYRVWRSQKNNKKSESIKTYRLLGSSLCNLDVFNHKAKLPEISVGDSIIFDKAGAYNFSSDFGSGSGIRTYIID